MLDNTASGAFHRAGAERFSRRALTAWVSESVIVRHPGEGVSIRVSAASLRSPHQCTRQHETRPPQSRATRIPPSWRRHLLLRGERPNWPRRQDAAARCSPPAIECVLCAMPERLHRHSRQSSPTQRGHRQRANWATWFIVPNAIYDSWESAVTGGTGTPCEQLQKKLDYLQP